MTRLILWLVTGILLALGVHVATLFAIPYFAGQSPSGGHRALAPNNVFAIAPSETIPFADPALRTALCHFDLSEGPVRIRAQATDGFTSVAVFNKQGLNTYALNDRAAASGLIEFTLYTPAQLADVRSREGPDTPQTLRIAAMDPKGIVAIRALVPTESEEGVVLDALSRATCSLAPR
jgi:uncharacterized membrane protein